MKEISKVVQGFKESVFTQMSNLANEFNAINLSQGLPNFDGPDWVKAFIKDAVDSSYNQSSLADGSFLLREAISNNFKKYYDLNYDSKNEITITTGATEGIFSSILALVNPGDEVIIFEPFFDTYIPAVELAGGKPVVVTLHAPEFRFNEAELEKAFSKKTKMVIINTPHNPSGKVFSYEELKTLTNLVKKHDCYLLTDEEYEFLTYDNAKHIPPATFEGMQERTLTISSTGKTFGFTGWRIGWVATTPKLSHAVRMVHQNNVFSAPHPQQVAMSKAFTRLDDYLDEFRKTYQHKRDILLDGLHKAGFETRIPQSTYFILTPISKNDVEFAKELITQKQVATIPTSAFYLNSKDGERYLRFCFAKTDEMLREAINHLLS